MIKQQMKPQGPANEMCPLWKAPCSEVCQTCHFWVSIPIPAKDPTTGESFQHGWKCSLVWVKDMALSQLYRTEAVGAEMEKMGKEFGRFKASIVALVGALAQVQNKAIDGGQLREALEPPPEEPPPDGS